jgi:hypothetical protein
MRVGLKGSRRFKSSSLQQPGRFLRRSPEPRRRFPRSRRWCTLSSTAANGEAGRAEAYDKSVKQTYEGKDLQGLVDLGREQGYLTFDTKSTVSYPVK